MPTPLQLTQGTTSFLGAPVSPEGSLTPEQIVNSLGFLTKGERGIALDCATTGNIPAYHSPLCSGTVSGSTLNISGALAQAGAVAAVKEGLGAIPVVGGALKGLASLVTLPFAHHKAAVKNEQTILCQAVPAATQLLQGVDELLLTGQIDARTAAAALDQGFQNWLQFVKPIYQEGKSKCNAACAYAKYIKAAMLYRKNKYNAAIALDARAANDVFSGDANTALPAGSSGQLVPARNFPPATKPAGATGATGAPAPLQQSVLSVAGVDSNKLVLAVIVLIVLGFGVAVNLSILRRTK